ncbi:MAG: VacJ [Neisseriaceae bacterium]|nr:VacJ [Neisseriaceae bacterium]
MYEVNRSVIVVIPQEPFWNWLQTLPDSDLEDLSLEDLQEDANAYFIHPVEDMDQAWDEIMQHLESIFSAELADWCEDTQYWPDLHPDIFSEWFAIELCTMATDLVSGDIERERFEPIYLNPDA